MDNNDILNRAARAFRQKQPRVQADIEADGGNPYFRVMGKRFKCVVEPNLTLGLILKHLKEPANSAAKDTPILYVTENVAPKVQELANLNNVNILDCAGNFNIQYALKNGTLFFMFANKGEKPVEEKGREAYPIFREAGLKVVFFFLMDKRNISRTYREIHEATGVSIGTVKNVIDGMVYYQFAKVENGKRFLINTDRLLMLWGANYNVTLKPKLLLARMAFRDGSLEHEWQRFGLPEGMYWGGEAAAAIADRFIDPGEFTIYTDVPAAQLVKTRVVEPDPDGNIAVYRKFWKENDNRFTVPAVLTYADLIETGNGRCIEAAQKMKENELEYLF